MTQALIDRLESFKLTLVAARDVGNPRDDPFLLGLRAGIQVCINGVDAEIEMIRAGMDVRNNVEVDQE